MGENIVILELALIVAVGIVVLVTIVVSVIICTPVRVSLDFNNVNKPQFQVTVALWGDRWPAFTINPAHSKNKAKKRAVKKSKASERQGRILYISHRLKAIPSFIFRVLAQIKFETVKAHITFGLPDPADTGMLYGMLTPIIMLVNAPHVSHISLQPNFSHSTLEGRCHIVARLTPITLVLPVLRFFWLAFVSPRLSTVRS